MAEYLKTWLRTRIHATRTLLLDITPRTPSQEIAHGRCIGRLDALKLSGETDPLDTGAVRRDDIDAMGFKASKEATRKQEARERLTLTQNIQTWMSSDHKLDCIEALLQRTELEREQHSQLEYAQRTGRMKQGADAKLMDIRSRHRDDIETCELDALRASLDYATFNTNMI